VYFNTCSIYYERTNRSKVAIEKDFKQKAVKKSRKEEGAGQRKKDNRILSSPLVLDGSREGKKGGREEGRKGCCWRPEWYNKTTGAVNLCGCGVRLHNEDIPRLLISL
jgi:hypothetical protein